MARPRTRGLAARLPAKHRPNPMTDALLVLYPQ
jgi:hypothetical protein